MLALACAMFVGVSCTPTPEGPVDPGYAVTITVDTPDVFPAAGGEQVLAYTLSSEVAGEQVAVESSASWLTATLDEQGEYKIYLTCSDNTNTPGSDPRQATVTVSYQDAKDVVLTVSQVSHEPQFSASFTKNSPVETLVSISHLTDATMQIGGFMIQGSQLNPGETPEDFAASWLDLMKSEFGGGYYLAFAQMSMYDPTYMLNYGAVSTAVSRYSGWEGVSNDDYYVCVVGLNVDSDMEQWIDNTTLATKLHVYKVEFEPAPEVSVAATELSLPYAAGTHTSAVSVANPYGEGAVSVESNAAWVEAAYADGQLTLTYAENPYAVGRKAEITVTYTYTCNVTQWGETYPAEIPATATIAVQQVANATVAPLTFTITVKDTHFDHILVDVVPSDLEAPYVLKALNAPDLTNPYGNNGDWTVVAENDAKYYVKEADVHTGALTDYKLAIDTQWIDEWSYYVYAFGYDAEAQAVASEVTSVLTEVTNDTPTLKLDLDYEIAPGLKIVYNEDTGNYELHSPAEGGTFTVKYNIENGVEGCVVRINNSSSDTVYDSYKVLADNDSSKWWNDAEQTFTFSVNPYDVAVTQSYKHYVTIYLRLYSDADKTQSMGQAVNLKVVQTAPAN